MLYDLLLDINCNSLKQSYRETDLIRGYSAGDALNIGSLSTSSCKGLLLIIIIIKIIIIIIIIIKTVTTFENLPIY